MYWYLGLGIFIGFVMGLLVKVNVSVTKFSGAPGPDEEDDAEQPPEP